MTHTTMMETSPAQLFKPEHGLGDGARRRMNRRRRFADGFAARRSLGWGV